MRLLVVLVVVLFILLGCESSTSSSHPALTSAPSDVSSIPQNATKLANGIAYRVLKSGNSELKPGMDSTVVVHYTGWTTDGRSFDSSITRGEPSKFGVSTVISGWTQALLLMSVGINSDFGSPKNWPIKVNKVCRRVRWYLTLSCWKSLARLCC